MHICMRTCINGFYWEDIERGDSSDDDCERGGMGKWRVNVVHMICIMDGLKGRGLKFL